MQALETAYLRAVRDLFGRIGELLGPVAAPIGVYIAGGAAVHWYTGHRVTKDVDAEFAARVLLGEVLINYLDDDGAQRQVYLDANYTTARGLMHEDYVLHARRAAMFDTDNLKVHMLAPVDLAVSKLSRWAPVDRDDIAALADAGLLRADELETRAREALVAAIGAGRFIEQNLREAVEAVRARQR